MRFVDRIWEGQGAEERIGRLLLTPLELLYRGAVAARGELYDRGMLDTRASEIPVVSIGNLTVGGTGKTPVASWIAARLSAAGMKPAIILSGYGADEILVHRRLNPTIEVVVDLDRARAIDRAASGGATVAVLDDGFQHRRARRDADIVLVSADAWTGRIRMLPSGPWREPLSSIARASLVIVTRKAAEQKPVEQVAQAVSDVAPEIPQAVVQLRIEAMTQVGDEGLSTSLSSLTGQRVLAVSAIGNPDSFANQLEQLGAVVTSLVYRDHHPFSAADAGRIATVSIGHDIILCTLKDAVKLGPIWPAGAPPLWYVSQSVDVQSGMKALDDLLAHLKRSTSSQSS